MSAIDSQSHFLEDCDAFSDLRENPSNDDEEQLTDFFTKGLNKEELTKGYEDWAENIYSHIETYLVKFK